MGHLMEARRSCRAYLPEQAPEATIRQMLAVAQRTASWCNAQPWRVVVAGGDAMEDQLLVCGLAFGHADSAQDEVVTGMVGETAVEPGQG